nr:glycosyltransferase family 9 protein [uncultured Campylobacter sp.]
MASAAVEAIAKHATAFDARNSAGKFENLGEPDFSFSSQNFGSVTQEIQIFKNSAANLSDKFDADGGVNLTANAQENQNLEISQSLAGEAVKIVFFGSFAACELFKAHPNCERVIVDDSKKAKFRLWRLFWQARELGKFDAVFSFRSSFASKILLYGARAGRKFVFQKSKDGAHQVQKYLKFVKSALNLKRADDELKLYFEPRKFDAPVLGLNPGASYGSAKRWYPAYFAQVALHFKDKFRIMIFGGAGERDMCEQIEKILRENGAECENLAGKTSVRGLCENIGGIGQSGGIFVTNDSGPMHIAAAYKTPTIALFGPTRFTQTCPWRNKNARILHLNLECMPCMKRVCPLGTRACMKDLSPQAVIQAIER